MKEKEQKFQLDTVRIRLVPDMPLFSDTPIDSSEDVADLMARELADWDREAVCVLNRDTKGKVLSMNVVSIGVLSGAMVHPREVFKSAILSNAESVVLVHNHPSRDVTPSEEDIATTKRMQEAGKILGICVLDHLIVGGEGNWYSMREHGEMDAPPSIVTEKLAKYTVRENRENNRQTYREKVKERFVQSLQENPQEWKKEWSSNETGRPYNMSSGHPYRGLNAFFLKFMEIAMEYRDPRWLTFKQATEAGYRIPKGTKMAPVEYFFMFDTKNRKTIPWSEYNKLKDAEQKEVITAADGSTQNRYILRSREHHVFNAAQLEGVPELDLNYEYHQIAPSEVVRSVAEGMGVEITEKEQGRAFYSPLTDSITLPLKEQFESDYAYQTTALHELGHATGHESRLGRDAPGAFGSPTYAFEELIAEITSCFMGEYLPIEAEEKDINNHVAYVQNWLEAIEKDPNYLYKAIKAADQAADYMIEKGSLEEMKEKTEEAEREDAPGHAVQPESAFVAEGSSTYTAAGSAEDRSQEARILHPERFETAGTMNAAAEIHAGARGTGEDVTYVTAERSEDAKVILPGGGMDTTELYYITLYGEKPGFEIIRTHILDQEDASAERIRSTEAAVRRVVENWMDISRGEYEMIDFDTLKDEADAANNRAYTVENGDSSVFLKVSMRESGNYVYTVYGADLSVAEEGEGSAHSLQDAAGQSFVDANLDSGKAHVFPVKILDRMIEERYRATDTEQDVASVFEYSDAAQKAARDLICGHIDQLEVGKEYTPARLHGLLLYGKSVYRSDYTALMAENREAAAIVNTMMIDFREAMHIGDHNWEQDVPMMMTESLKTYLHGLYSGSWDVIEPLKDYMQRCVQIKYMSEMPVYQVIRHGRISAHSEDDHLMVILARNQKTGEYATWIHNEETGLQNGHYNLTDLATASTDYYERKDPALRPPYRLYSYDGRFTGADTLDEDISVNGYEVGKLSESLRDGSSGINLAGYYETEEEGMDALEALAREYPGRHFCLELEEYDEDGELYDSEQVMATDGERYSDRQAARTIEIMTSEEKGETILSIQSDGETKTIDVTQGCSRFVGRFQNYARAYMEHAVEHIGRGIRLNPVDPISIYEEAIGLYSEGASYAIEAELPPEINLTEDEIQHVNNYMEYCIRREIQKSDLNADNQEERFAVELYQNASEVMKKNERSQAEERSEGTCSVINRMKPRRLSFAGEEI